MKQITAHIQAIVILYATMTATYSHAAVIDFDNIAIGTVYGESGFHSEGQEVLWENGVIMTVERFKFGSFTDFFDATVIGPDPDAFPSNSLSLNQINVAFDFTQLGFIPNVVSFEFRDLGGSNNFSVNGGPTIELSALANIPAIPASGVAATVINNQIILTGDIDRILVGGQETIIDNISYVPEPASLLLLAIGICPLIYRRRLSCR